MGTQGNRTATRCPHLEFRVIGSALSTRRNFGAGRNKGTPPPPPKEPNSLLFAHTSLLLKRLLHLFRSAKRSSSSEQVGVWFLFPSGGESHGKL